MRATSQVARQRGRRGDVGRRGALVPQPAAHAGRPVGGHDRPQADRRLVVQRPEVGAGEQADLLLQTQRGEEFLHDASV